MNELRTANIARHAEWDSGGQVTLSYRGNEMAGEVGEALEAAISLLTMGAAAGRACNVLKKLERERMGMVGSRGSIEGLAAELADVVICADLVAMSVGVDLDAAVRAKFNATSVNYGLATRMPIARADKHEPYQPLVEGSI